MITIKDKTGPSTLHITNTGGDDYVSTVVYELEVNQIDNKIKQFNKFNNLVTKEEVQKELDKIKELIK